MEPAPKIIRNSQIIKDNEEPYIDQAVEQDQMRESNDHSIVIINNNENVFLLGIANSLDQKQLTRPNT